MSFECFFFIRVDREKKKKPAQTPNTKKKRERTEQIRVERKEIETQCEQAALH
jgi:hypothetical protein